MVILLTFVSFQMCFLHETGFGRKSFFSRSLKENLPMNFPLKNLELHLPEECLVLSERLYEEGGVEELRETEKHLWVAWVAGLEVEVQVSPSKVLAASCECADFQGRGMCAHVGSVLFALRREQQKRKECKRRRQRTTRRLTVNAVIEQARPEELLAFVRQYAKTNRAFALALKARFARAVSTSDEREKYSRLLETALQGHRDEKDNITYRGALSFLGVGRELLKQVQDALALEHFAEAQALLEVLVDKCAATLNKVDKQRDALEELLRNALEELQRLIGKQPPPNLLEELWRFALHRCTAPTFKAAGCTAPLFEILLALAVEAPRRALLRNLLLQELNQPHAPEAYLLECFFCLHRLEPVEDLPTAFARRLENGSFLFHSVEEARRRGEGDLACLLLQAVQPERLSAVLRQQWWEARLTLAQERREAEMVVALARRLYLEGGFRPEHLRLCKEWCREDWPAFVDGLLEELHRLSPKPAVQLALIQLLQEENRLETLLEYLRSEGNLDLLLQMGLSASLTGTPEFERLCLELVDAYLKQHLGRPPAVRLRRLLIRLLNQGADRLAERLLHFTLEHYGDRPALMEELEVFASRNS